MLDLIKFIESLTLKLDFSDGVVILLRFCLLVEESSIFITSLEPKATHLYSLVILFSSQRFMKSLLQIDLSIKQLWGDRGGLHKHLVVA